LNDDLANLYGINGSKENSFARSVSRALTVAVLLTQASITDHPKPTHLPVKRGKWVLENILGAPPPFTSANVPVTQRGKEALRKALSVTECDSIAQI
jgi:hypothetical protein